MNKELIAMCDCPEILDKWVEIRYGDKCCDPDTREECIVTALLVSGRMIICSIEDGISDNVHPSNMVYIPRIEDVLEWLSAKMAQKKAMYEISFMDEDNCLQGAIKYYMHLDHNKTWGGETLKWKMEG